jgi:putative N6-adenine-specific DNA methylase
MDFYCYAVTAPGLKDLTARELSALGLAPNNSDDPGGVDFKTDLEGLYRANLGLRTASRVLVRLGNFFYARTFAELREACARLPWERYLRPGQPIDLRVTCHKSKLYHSDAVAERIGQAIAQRLGQESPLQKPAPNADIAGVQRIQARLAHDRVTISIDSSGENLHRRGYRLATAKAPLRETLAAALLFLCGWDTRAPLLDPFCGSGTIAIEAALLALQIAPGLNRRFAFMDWPGFEQDLWQNLRIQARALQRDTCAPILASDRDQGAIEIARQNAARAGVEAVILFECQAVSAIQPPKQTGWVITNPPYGERISPGKDLRNLYARFGSVLRSHCPGWQVGILSSDHVLLAQTGLRLESSTRLVNGGLPVLLARGHVD